MNRSVLKLMTQFCDSMCSDATLVLRDLKGAVQGDVTGVSEAFTNTS